MEVMGAANIRTSTGGVNRPIVRLRYLLKTTRTVLVVAITD